ncbi:hypothetical protein O181_002688 [Austropuccinia psidii MF-1]|uniref:RRM domain-containing protein n=1 Tax=Austropuccinia psidii MF-1 TaxID=1389203 RepID=A0A9Q3BD73_9BASI|nr:hypothetical protein [Austropuccinia psidii MF-1]
MLSSIQATKAINERELKLGIKASWHDDYKDSAYIYIGGLDPELTEGDIITIFSQYGEPVDINLPKEKPRQQTTDVMMSAPEPSSSSLKPQKVKSRGFCFLMYENQLSTNLAVDNLNGAVVLGRTLKVDHCKNYKQLERNENGKMVERDADLGERLNARPELHLHSRAKNDEGNNSDDSVAIDPEDPMANYLLEKRRKRQEKKDRKRLQSGRGERAQKSESHKHKRKDDRTEEAKADRKAAKRNRKLYKESSS